MQHICDAILNAKKRGVTIRIVSDCSMINSSNSQVNILQGAGKYTTKTRDTNLQCYLAYVRILIDTWILQEFQYELQVTVIYTCTTNSA